MLPTLFLLANFTMTPTNDTRVTCSVSGLPGPIRNWLKSLSIPLTAPVYWAVAGEKPGAQNGLTITKGRFVYRTLVQFNSGETVIIEHRGQGINEKGVFVVDVDLKGGTPKLPSDADVKFPDFEEVFTKTGVGEISSLLRYVYVYLGRKFSSNIQIFIMFFSYLWSPSTCILACYCPVCVGAPILMPAKIEVMPLLFSVLSSKLSCNPDKSSRGTHLCNNSS